MFCCCSYKLKLLQTDGYEMLVWLWDTGVSDRVSSKTEDLKTAFPLAKCSKQQAFVENGPDLDVQASSAVALSLALHKKRVMW